MGESVSSGIFYSFHAWPDFIQGLWLIYFYLFFFIQGNTDVTRLVLEHGAKIDHQNSVNRTAAQMAAFVGQHQCVRIINNYFPKHELEYFTVPRGLSFFFYFFVCVYFKICKQIIEDKRQCFLIIGFHDTISSNFIIFF